MGDQTGGISKCLEQARKREKKKRPVDEAKKNFLTAGIFPPETN